MTGLSYEKLLQIKKRFLETKERDYGPEMFFLKCSKGSVAAQEGEEKECLEVGFVMTDILEDSDFEISSGVESEIDLYSDYIPLQGKASDSD